MKTRLPALLGLSLLSAPLPGIAQSSDFTYGTVIGGYSITGYIGPGGSVTIPASFNGQPIVAIGPFALQNKTTLTSVSIPINLRSIGVEAFTGCSSLTAITADAGNTNYSSVDGVLFNKSQTMLVLCPGGKAGNYVIPNGVNELKAYAFESCASLTNITIAETITNIHSGAFQGCFRLTNVTIPASVTAIEDSVFDQCTGLQAITVDGANAVYSSEDGVLFDKSQTTLIKCPGGKAGSYSIPANVTSLKYAAFSYCFTLTNITIPRSIIDLGQDAFDYCPNLQGVFFKGNVPNFLFRVFDSTSSATVYYLPGTIGWGTTFADRPTVLWDPVAEIADASFGVQTNRFGFTITGASSLVIVVEASTSLVNPAWVPLGTNILIGGSSYFSDPEWTSYPARTYRFRSP